jgi:hypothetical protein
MISKTATTILYAERFVELVKAAQELQTEEEWSQQQARHQIKVLADFINNGNFRKAVKYYNDLMETIGGEGLEMLPELTDSKMLKVFVRINEQYRDGMLRRSDILDVSEEKL